MIDRNKIGREIIRIFCWQGHCPECVLQENCLNTTPEEAIDVARKNMGVFIEKFHLINSFLGEKAARSAAFSFVVGAKMK